MMKKDNQFYLGIIICTFILVLMIMPKWATAQCPCTTTTETTYWEPNLKDNYKTGDYGGGGGNFGNTINGVYVAFDKDSIYQIKILIESQSYSRFVHFQHISFSRLENIANRNNVLCKELPQMKDGGWFGIDIYTPKSAINKRYLASEFFKGDRYFKVDEQHFYELYQCVKESKYGIIDRSRQRYYRKVFWEPRGNYPEISLFGLLQKDLKKYNKEQLAEMRNEVFARYNFEFKEGGKWDKKFENLGNYRRGQFKDVSLFITTLEKENLDYIKGFETGDYYDNQLQNDFLDFWGKFRKAVISGNYNEINAFVKFPFEIDGEWDHMPVIKIGKEKFPQVWSILLEQENYEGGDNFLTMIVTKTKSVFQQSNAFDDQMIHTKSNNLNNLGFEKINGVWKLSGAYADSENYPKIETIVKKK